MHVKKQTLCKQVISLSRGGTYTLILFSAVTEKNIQLSTVVNSVQESEEPGEISTP